MINKQPHQLTKSLGTGDAMTTPNLSVAVRKGQRWKESTWTSSEVGWLVGGSVGRLVGWASLTIDNTWNTCVIQWWLIIHELAKNNQQLPWSIPYRHRPVNHEAWLTIVNQYDPASMRRKASLTGGFPTQTITSDACSLGLPSWPHGVLIVKNGEQWWIINNDQH